MSKQQKIYPGILNDHFGGMTDIGKIIRDAWVFGLLPETETCEGWEYRRLETLYEKVHSAWEPYGHMMSQLPDDLRERHVRIYAQALEIAREKGWDPELGDHD